MPQAQIVT